MNSNRRKNPARLGAFTLIELLTVIAIIGILAAIIIPTVGKVRSAARSTRAISNVKQVGMATLLYAQENRNQLLGHGDGGAGFTDSERMFRMWATYLNKSPNAVKERVVNILTGLADPAVPDNLLAQSYGTYGTTWTVNRIFNVHGGRLAQGTGPYYGNTGGRPRLVQEFQDPSRTLYAVSGRGYEISATNIVDPALLNPTGDVVQPIYYFHRDGKGTPAVFLDGHTAMLSFPIDPTLTKLSQFN